MHSPDPQPIEDHAAAATSPRGRPLARAAQKPAHNAGGEDHIRLGDDPVVYTCGLTEAQMRLALEPGAAADVRRQPGAGVRLPERSRKVLTNIGGTDSLRDMWGQGGGEVYSESVAGAQARLAHDPAVRLEAEAVAMAGRRVDAKWLGASIRTTRPVGGPSSLALGWREDSWAREEERAGAPRRPAAEVAASEKLRILRPDQPVGGRSGAWMRHDDAPAAVLARPSTAGGRRGGQDSSGALGVLSWGDAALSAGAPTARAAAAPPPPPPTAPAGKRPSTAAPAFMGSPRLRREQPLGGRSGAAAGALEEVGASRARPSTAAGAPSRGSGALAHTTSSFSF